ncbi:hypothetical protein [Cognatishimia sp. F0-27]|uniref:hypothetical protein n=1 Tax=Cognatishimia sp. F0-27 TaxID=2816855 RepID=UPI001D0C2243|nr:hypothetical protein [Cognatishimia sp. F0-27]MCC1494278.1 hypothetical protein [Cognatishimia sp. F0-27]
MYLVIYPVREPDDDKDDDKPVCPSGGRWPAIHALATDPSDNPEFSDEKTRHGTTVQQFRR